MKQLLIIAALTLAIALSAIAAEVQIIVRNDSSTIVVNTTIITTDAVLKALNDWRKAHIEDYPGPESLFREMIIAQSKRILRITPTPAMQAQRDAIKAAKAAEDAELAAAVQ